MNQAILPFDWPAEADPSEFIVSSSNAEAVRHLDSWGRWPVKASLLTGPRKSGKSLLGRIFAAKTGGTLIDDADRKPETQIFHAWNRAQEEGRPLLLVADDPPPLWKVGLADLRSRLGATPHIRLGEPDDALMRALMTRLAERRGLALAPQIVDFLCARIERSHIALHVTIERLDAAALSQKRRITLPFVRELLQKAEHDPIDA